VGAIRRRAERRGHIRTDATGFAFDRGLEAWSCVPGVRYPSRRARFELISNPACREVVRYKLPWPKVDFGAGRSRRTRAAPGARGSRGSRDPEPDAGMGEADEGRPVQMLNVMRYYDKLQPSPGSKGNKKTPAEANAYYKNVHYKNSVFRCWRDLADIRRAAAAANRNAPSCRGVPASAPTAMGGVQPLVFLHISV